MRQPLSVAVALLAFAGIAHAAETPEAQATAYLGEVQQKTGDPAISVAVAHHGKIIYSCGMGFADLENKVPAGPATVYNIGSVSKVITAIAVMQLVEKGTVLLDDDIHKYVPAFPDKGHPITVRHLMTHTSGIRHYRPTDFPGSVDNENLKPVRSFDDAIAIFKDDPLLFEPGQYYFYSSYAVNLLQGVVEKAGGMAFEEYLRRNVWTPASMASTQFDIPPRIVPNRARSYYLKDGNLTNYPYGDLTYKFASGGMLSTVEDLVRLAVAFNHGALLKPETVALMITPVAPLLQYREKGPPEKLAFEQALIWRIRTDDAGKPFLNHCGTVKGFNACLIDYRDDDLVIAIAANAFPEAPAIRDAVAIGRFFAAQ